VAARHAQEAHVIELSDVSVGARLKNISLTLGDTPDGVIVIVGENGAGKSTLLDVIAGVTTPTSGSVVVNGAPMSSLSPTKRATLIASIGAGDPGIDDVTAATRIAHGLAARRGSRALMDAATLATVERVAEELAVSKLLERTLGELSSGERRRVHVARALVDDAAQIYILDEPHTAVDVRHQALVSAALAKRAAAGKLVVVSAHDLGIAASLGARIVGLRDGRVVVDCAQSELLTSSILERLYGIAQARIVTIGN
jgi:iron complex transport system ATP-binding protein